jgi:hypothetical protein
MVRQNDLNGHFMFTRALVFSFCMGLVVLCSCKTGKVCDAREESEYCEIHHLFMRSEKFPNPHLKIPPSQEYMQVRMRYFIHSKPTLFMLPDECKSCMVYICDDCVHAEEQWKATHPGFGR